MRLVSLDLRSKLAGLAFLLVSVVVAALTMYFSALQAADSEKSLQAKALMYGQLLAHETESAIAFGDSATTREVFEAASLDPDVQGLTLYKANGAILGAVGRRSLEREAVSEPVVRRTSSVIGVVVPVASKEGPRGVLVLELSVARIKAEQARGRRVAALAGLVSAAIGLLASWMIGGSFARRVRRIEHATRGVANGNLDEPPIEDRSSDEIGRLGEAFNIMAQHIRELVGRIEANGREEAARLDRIVVARTLELEWKNEDLAFILDNVGQGFATVDRTGRLAAERSAILGAWFGDAPEGVHLWDYVTAADPEASRWLAVGWEAIFDGILPPELALDQLPKEVRRGETTFGLRYQPIMNGSAIETVLLVVSDASDEIARRKAEAKQREMADVFARLVSDPSSIEQFISEGTVLVHSIESGVASDVSLSDQQRWIHTLKGNSSFLGLERLATICHEMETQIADTGEAPSAKLLAALGQMWAEFLSVVEPLTLGRRDRAVVRTATLRSHIEAIQTGTSRPQLVSDVESWLLEPTSTCLERAAQQARAVARRLEKPEPTVLIESNDVKLDAQTWAPFWSAFVHVVRNAVDHGLEDPEVRRQLGKSEVGTIALRTTQRPGETVIEIEDDGAGIDWQTLRQRVGVGHAASEEELLGLLFEGGLSTKTESSETSGRGVGLSAVRSACEAMGGQLEVRTRTGAGTTFSFRVPSELSKRSRGFLRPAVYAA